jgi:hypothetical protein
LRLRESHGRDEQVHRRLLDVGAERIRRRCHVITPVSTPQPVQSPFVVVD